MSEEALHSPPQEEAQPGPTPPKMENKPKKSLAPPAKINDPDVKANPRLLKTNRPDKLNIGQPDPARSSNKSPRQPLHKTASSPRFNSERTPSKGNQRLSLIRNSTDPKFRNLPKTPQPRSKQESETFSRPNSARRYQQFRQSLPIFHAPEITPEVLKLKEKAIKGNLPTNLPIKTYDDIIYALSEDRKQMAAQHKFKDGAAFSDAIEYTKNRQMEARKVALQKEASENAQKELDATREEVKAFDNETEKLLAEVIKNEEKQRKELNEQHEKELNEHEALWCSDIKIKNYNRASPTLAALKKQINTMLVQARFEDAEKVQAIYDEKKREEEEASHKLMQHDFDESLKKILESHREESEYFETCSQVRILQFKVNRSKERNQLENKLRKNEGRADVAGDSERIWNRTTNARQKEISEGAMNAGLPSTKMTRKDLKDADIELLTLPPLDLKRNRRI